MARYKVVDLSPKFLVVDLEKQLLSGSFAFAVHPSWRTTSIFPVLMRTTRMTKQAPRSSHRECCSKSSRAPTLKAWSAARHRTPMPQTRRVTSRDHWAVQSLPAPS